MREVKIFNYVQEETDTEESEYSHDVFCFYGSSLADCEGNRHAHDEEESWEDQVSAGETVPFGMDEPPAGSLYVVGLIRQDHPQHCQPSIDVQRLQSLSF